MRKEEKLPYIKKENREEIDPFVEKLFDHLETKGDMNYAITKLLHKYIKREGLKYSNLNDAIGIVECVKLELYRKVVVNYENIKIEENGDIEL